MLKLGHEPTNLPIFSEKLPRRICLMKVLHKLAGQAPQLLLFRDVFEDEIGQVYLKLLRSFRPPDIEPDEIGQAYAKLFELLAGAAEFYEGEMVGDVLQNHLLDRILASNNPFSRKAGLPIGPTTLAAAQRDLTILYKFFVVNSTTLAEIARNSLDEPNLPAWDHFDPSSAHPTPSDSYLLTFKRRLATTTNWPLLVDELADYYAQVGVDELARNMAFRWQRATAGFEPIAEVDPIRLEDLVGYELERGLIVQNTEQFLAGLPANNVLLYGARGTGKSSTVKGLLNRYGEKGLRLIEVHKDWLGDYPLIVRQVRGRREKFILFVDDFSFEEDEIVYKDLKALLEGSIEARPNNLLIYATSNRRHLIKEQFSDNPHAGDQGEIAAWDTVEEKLSLSDRFGLLITFVSPNQRQYLDIVYALADRANIQMERELLKRQALQWELSHSGRSGRVARQFVDQLSGQLSLAGRMKEKSGVRSQES